MDDSTESLHCVCVCVRRGGLLICYTPQEGYSTTLICTPKIPKDSTDWLFPQVKEFAPVSGVFVLITAIRHESNSLESSLMMKRLMFGFVHG